MSLLTKIFGTYSEREVRKLNKTIDAIEKLRPVMQKMSDEDLKAKTVEFKSRLEKGESLDNILPEAFAVVREASKRTIGLEHYRVQLIGGVIIHQGRIAELKTGEGKSNTCSCPAYLNALEGKGVHVVTVNEYLSKRDFEQMRQVHEFLGLSVGLVSSGMTPAAKRMAYNCDITYVTNSELGFDYLRDNMVTNSKNRVQRGLHFSIIDEIDSILIDEARTPLIISGKGEQSNKVYRICDIVAKNLKRGKNLENVSKFDFIAGYEEEEDGDFQVDPKVKTIALNAAGINKIERCFKLNNFADPENLEIVHCMQMALRANNIMERDKDYIVTVDGEILIVDQFTGRTMPGRRYSDGLHQAIEAKEGVLIKDENLTMATITYQNFFNKYKKKAGMTGTAMTEDKEFKTVYELDVVEVPTHKPVIRKDLQDKVYKTKAEKIEAIINKVKTLHEVGQPVLVGTTTIEQSEELSRELKKIGIKHEVLNAKYHEKEAEIVALAGQHGAVTIATNMAGRGTDIKLDDEARAAGGLYIIGTERHESRRIDNQLRGRSGRQGDPGVSEFYISLEDNLMKLFGSESLVEKFNAIGMEHGAAIEHKLLSKAIEDAQKKIENINFGQRKRIIDYDAVINEQRDIIYNERDKVIDSDDVSKFIKVMLKEFIDESVNTYLTEDEITADTDLVPLSKKLEKILTLRLTLGDVKVAIDKEALRDKIKEIALKLYEDRENEIGDAMRALEKQIMLRFIDQKWRSHLDNMEALKEGIGLQAYGQKDPVIEYKMIGYDMFEEMTTNIKEDTLSALLRIRREV